MQRVWSRPQTLPVGFQAVTYFSSILSEQRMLMPISPISMVPKFTAKQQRAWHHWSGLRSNVP